MSTEIDFTPETVTRRGRIFEELLEHRVLGEDGVFGLIGWISAFGSPRAVIEELVDTFADLELGDEEDYIEDCDACGATDGSECYSTCPSFGTDR